MSVTRGETPDFLKFILYYDISTGSLLVGKYKYDDIK